jgi:hypothetical protein
MTDDRIALRALVEMGPDADFLREMIGFATEWLMTLNYEFSVGGKEKALHVIGVPFQRTFNSCILLAVGRPCWPSCNKQGRTPNLTLNFVRIPGGIRTARLT